MKRNAFTMLELVFVIVVLGILAAVAVPKLAATRDDAQISKGRSDVSAIRSAIVSERQSRLIRGDSSYISRLDQGVAEDTVGVTIFDDNDSNITNGSLLMYGVTTKYDNGHWIKDDSDTYIYRVVNTDISFDYNNSNGTFTCNRSAAGDAGRYCKALID